MPTAKWLGSGRVRDSNPSLVSPIFPARPWTLKIFYLQGYNMWICLSPHVHRRKNVHVSFGNKLVLPSQKPVWNENIKNRKLFTHSFDLVILVPGIHPKGIISSKWKNYSHGKSYCDIVYNSEELERIYIFNNRKS